MARPLRLEFAGALYHVTARGDRKGSIYLDDADRRKWLCLLEEVCRRYRWVIHAYCQMTNHYHLIVETPDGNLSKGMRQLNGVYTQYFNRTHDLVGHLFQGRYKGILVQKEAYLLELSRYVVLNPVRAGVVSDPLEWHWSSYRAMLREDDAELDALDSDWLLAQFGKHRNDARKAYQRFVAEGTGKPGPWPDVRYQLYLGDDDFIQHHQLAVPDAALCDVSMTQRRAFAMPLNEYQDIYKNRDEAMAHAYLSGAYTMKQIGDFFGVHTMTVSRAVRHHEKSGR